MTRALQVSSLMELLRSYGSTMRPGGIFWKQDTENGRGESIGNDGGKERERENGREKECERGGEPWRRETREFGMDSGSGADPVSD